ncbi:plastidic glucose transporter 4-like, partial [Trifolium medium]|nr:plastidic glucose transporter 4-like [Trifolium medium]
MSSCFGLRSDSAIMETELTSNRGRSFGSIFGSNVKPRPLRFQPS